MKAAVINRFGGPEVFSVEEVPTPVAGPGQVLVKVHGVLVNRLDHYIRNGDITQDLKFPHVLGLDAVGEIAVVGEGVRKFRLGERVITMPGYPSDPGDYAFRPTTLAPSYSMRGLQLPGTYAQYVAVPQEFVLHDKTGLPPESAAALPVPLMTAINAVQKVGEVKKGDFVLIHAGGSATGYFGIQVARALDARVAATARSVEAREMASEAGAELVINVSDDEFNDWIAKWTDGRGVDVAIDSLGGDTFEKTINAVKTGGIIVAMGFMSGAEVKFDIRNLFFREKQIRGSLTADIEDFAKWLEPVRKGIIKPKIDCALPLSQARKAHELVSQNKARGAVILLPWE
ncbi:MAG: zinc-binding dehydrogenase [Candidatus Obscuribacterales bacterium]|nr:zinc-binding dehydrogenase [Candidatus Obscuribacterales bacterium]